MSGAVGEDDEDVAGHAADLDALRLLSGISELLSRRDQEQAVSELARLVVPALADWCTVTVTLDTRDRRTLGWAHRDPAVEPVLAAYAAVQADQMSEESAIATCLRTGEPVLVPELPPLSTYVADESALGLLQRLAPGSVAVLPLKAAGRTLGALALVTDRGRGPMSARTLDIAREVARRAGLALDNARLYTEQRQLVEALQRSLLTPPPSGGPLEVAVRYVAAAEEAQVGGDWYDAYVDSQGSAHLAIGDVVGHDRHSAAAMGQLRSLLRGIGYATSAHSAALLTAVDDAMRGLDLDTTATVVVVRVEGQRRGGALELSWSNAGHPPPLLLRDGTARVLSAEPDLLLGLDPDTERHESRADLPPGATLLLYTDGLVERRGEDLDVGVARLQQALVEHGHLPLEALVDALVGRMLGGTAPDDDAAVLVARPRPAHREDTTSPHP